MDLNIQKIDEVLPFSEGKLKIMARRRVDRTTDILPKEPYIWIDYIEAEPRGRRLLRCHAPTVMARIRDGLGGKGPILLNPAADQQPGDTTSQSRLECYYLSCGFTWYHNTGLMSWAQTPDATKN